MCSRRFHLHFHSAITALILVALTASPAFASLIITNGDITGGEYVYTLDYNDMVNSTKLNSDADTASHFTLTKEGAGGNGTRYFAATGGQTSATILYKFDFTATSYRPTSVQLTDYLGFFSSNLTAGITGDTAWSTDGVNYTTLLSIASTTTATSDQKSEKNKTVALSSQPDVFYYRVEFSRTGGGFPGGRLQWNRAGSQPGNTFKADFTMVLMPEPASGALALALLGGLMLLSGRRFAR